MSVEKFENYCMAWGLDGVSFLQFDFLNTSKCWNDYDKSIRTVKYVFDYLNISNILEYLMVIPSFDPDKTNLLSYNLNFDDNSHLYLAIDIEHNIDNGVYSITITEYDARFCKSKEQVAYHYSNIFGPFMDTVPLNNQDLYERARIWGTKITKHLKATTNVNE